MITINLTDFRSHASGMFNKVENGETVVVLRHGRPIAEVSPIVEHQDRQPSWKKPALRLAIKGAGLSSAILEERTDENIS